LTPGRDGAVHRGFLLVDDELIAAGDIERVTWSRLSITGAGLAVGWPLDFSPADRDDRGPFRFTGCLDRVEIDVDGDGCVDPHAEAADLIRSQ
jgi:hypothetical protein